MDAAFAFSKQSFDFIVVGGGTTGLALATLLSNNPNVRVGVIEAGKRIDDDFVLIPGMIGQVLGKPEYDWKSCTIPQAAANDRQLIINRGRLLGGSSALNYMAYTRGSRAEHDDWEALGVTGWNWSVIQDAIKASEAWSPPSEYAIKHHADNDAQAHGRDGYIKTTAYPYYFDLALPFFKTMNELGVKTNMSESSGNLIGVWTYTASVDPETGSRSYSANAYYDRVSSRPNIVVLTGALVHRVLLEDNQNGLKRAKGVEFSVGNRLFYATVLREVIISAGALQTPQVLELSGIGNPEILRGLNIPVQVDLPGVGENFQDHFSVTMGAVLRGMHETMEDMASDPFAEARLAQYRESKLGLLSSTLSTLVFLPAQTFIRPEVMKAMLNSLDEALAGPTIRQSPWRKVYELQRSWLEKDGVAQLEMIFFPSYIHDGCTDKNERHYTMSVFLQHAWCRGHVHAVSPSPLDPPEIDLGVLRSPGDIDMIMLVEAIKYAFKVMQTGPLGAETARIIEPLPTWSDSELRQYVRAKINSSVHPIGTASMLPRSQGGVVDNNLKVYGTSNVRVADASIIPIHVGTHPQATLYGLAHRAADIIQAKGSS